MRRKDREVTDFNKITEMIDKCEILRLGLCDGTDFPYIVPVNFAYKVDGENIEFYIHGAMAGRKFELLSKNPKCSFEMDRALLLDLVYEAKDATERYECVMGTAEATLLEGEEKEKAIDEIIMARYESTKNFEYSKSALPRTAVFKLKVTSISAKANPLRSGADI